MAFAEKSRPQPPKVISLIAPFVLVVLYVPLVAMVASSFIGAAGGFSFEWYGDVFHDPVLLEALGRSLIVSFSSALISTGLGLFGALALEKWLFRARPLLQGLSLLSLMMPELVLALSLLSWFALLKINLSLLTVTAAHVTLTGPFTLLVIGARARTLEPSLEDAARDLGASEGQILRRVTLPLLRPALVTAFILAFLLSFDDFLVTFYTNGVGQDTLPVRLYSLMKTGITPKVQALSSLLLLLSVALVIILVSRRGLKALHDD